MSENGARRSAAPLNCNEWCILVNVACYLASSGPAHDAHTALTSCMCLALITGIVTSTVQEAICLANSGEVLPAIAGSVTHISYLKETFSSAYTTLVWEFILMSNRDDHLVTTQLLLTFLNEPAYAIYAQPAAILKHDLCHMGFYYGHGNHQNILHNSQAVLNYRALYLEWHIVNLNANDLPKYPEIFLDESYCHLDHHSRMTWVKKGGIVNKWGKKLMLVIFRAFIIFRQDNHLYVELVPDNILIWPVKGGIHRQAAPHRHGEGHGHGCLPAQGNDA